MIDVFERVTPSVAFIKNATIQWDWFSATAYEVPRGAGSGFVWDTQGHIVTNFHVVYQAHTIEVQMPGQPAYPATVIGFSADHDLAVLKIDAPPDQLQPIDRSTSADLRVGQSVLAIGNPFGLDHSLTTGVISAMGRSISSITGRKINGVIQTDAAINPGNSGGPLLDSSGRLIGVSTAIYSPSGASAGIGFAIPVDTVNRIVPQLIQYGRVKRAGLGVTLVPDRIRQRLGVRGAAIMGIGRRSAAAESGLQPTRRDRRGRIRLGDVIVAVDGVRILNNEDLLDALEEGKAGEEIDVTFERDGATQDATITLQELR